jgi:hypothetical protein
LLGQHLQDRGDQGGLAVVNVTDRPNVRVRFRPFKFAFCHAVLLSASLDYVT